MSNIFACAHWAFECLLWRNLYSIFCSFLKLGACFFDCWTAGIFYILWVLTSYQIYNFQMCSKIQLIAFSIVNLSFFLYSVAPAASPTGLWLNPSQLAHSILFITIIYLPEDEYRTQAGPLKIHPKDFLQSCCERSTVFLGSWAQWVCQLQTLGTSFLSHWERTWIWSWHQGAQSSEIEPWRYYWSI